MKTIIFETGKARYLITVIDGRLWFSRLKWAVPWEYEIWIDGRWRDGRQR